MERASDVIKYILSEYRKISGNILLREKKVNQLLYFTQRESLAVTGEPMFEEKLKRHIDSLFCDTEVNLDARELSDKNKYIVSNVILQYGCYEQWKLDEFIHREQSWCNAEQWLSNADACLRIEDIRKDAEKVRPYDSIYDMYLDEFEDAK